MRRSAIVVSALFALLAACGTSSAEVAEARIAAETVNGLCPVREELVLPFVFVESGGQKVGFCCSPCKEEFRAEPEMFLSKMRADRDRFGYIGR